MNRITDASIHESWPDRVIHVNINRVGKQTVLISITCLYIRIQVKRGFQTELQRLMTSVGINPYHRFGINADRLVAFIEVHARNLVETGYAMRSFDYDLRTAEEVLPPFASGFDMERCVFI